MPAPAALYRFGSATDDALTPRPGKDTIAAPGVPDDPAQGGQPGHGVIAPLDGRGKVDQAMLDEWASSRGSGRRHPLTQAVLDAIVERDVRSQT
jgi:hypothetical protein